MTNKEAIEIAKNIGFYVPLLDSQKEALEKLINTAETIKWVNLMGDLSVLIDVDPNRYKINREDWLAERDVPLEYFLDKLHEVINNDERRV